MLTHVTQGVPDVPAAGREVLEVAMWGSGLKPDGRTGQRAWERSGLLGKRPQLSERRDRGVHRERRGGTGEGRARGGSCPFCGGEATWKRLVAEATGAGGVELQAGLVGARTQGRGCAVHWGPESELGFEVSGRPKPRFGHSRASSARPWNHALSSGAKALGCPRGC